MEKLRTIETRLAILTLVGLAMYAPVETVASWQMFGGPAVLIHPGYLQSLTAMILLAVGVWHSLRARPRRAPALLCVSHAFCAGTFWHAAALRMSFVQRGIHLFYGSPELIAVAAGAAIMLGMFGVSLFLTYRAGSTCLEPRDVHAATLGTEGKAGEAEGVGSIRK